LKEGFCLNRLFVNGFCGRRTPHSDELISKSITSLDKLLLGDGFVG
jgi:hypothetical protein